MSAPDKPQFVPTVTKPETAKVQVTLPLPPPPPPQAYANRDAAPVVVDADAMSAAEPTLDKSKYIEYRYYECQLCHRKEFAGGLDTAGEAECICTPGGMKPESTKAQPKPIHGIMKLHHYKKLRPVENA